MLKDAFVATDKEKASLVAKSGVTAALSDVVDMALLKGDAHISTGWNNSMQYKPIVK